MVLNEYTSQYRDASDVSVRKAGNTVSDIGRRVKERREALNLTLRELGQRTGFSASFISQLERGQCSISITSLDKIAKQLGVEIAYFFPQKTFPNTGRVVTRKHERPRMLVEGSTLSFEALSGDFPGRILDVFLVRLQPGEIQDGTYRHGGEEFGYVLCGPLVMEVDGEVFELQTDDTVHFPSTLPHMWQNRSNHEVRAIWVITERVT